MMIVCCGFTSIIYAIVLNINLLSKKLTMQGTSAWLMHIDLPRLKIAFHIYQQFLKAPGYHCFICFTQKVFIPGDNDVGGEGFEMKEKWKLDRFFKSFDQNGNRSSSDVINVKFVDFLKVCVSSANLIFCKLFCVRNVFVDI